MKQMNTREKILTLLVLSAAIFTGAKFFVGRMDREVASLGERLTRAQEQSKDAGALIARPTHSVDSNDAEEKVTLSLLWDLNAPGVARGSDGGVRIVGVERSSPKSFRLTIEGKFAELMRYVSYLERPDGRFVLVAAEVVRSGGAGGKGQTPLPVDVKSVRAVLNIEPRS